MPKFRRFYVRLKSELLRAGLHALAGLSPQALARALDALAPGTLVFLPAMLLGLWLGTRLKSLDALATKGATS